MTTLDRELEELQGARCETESTTEFWGIIKEFIQEKNPLQNSWYLFESVLQRKTNPKMQFLPKDTEHITGEHKQFSVIAVSLYSLDDLPLFNL